MTDEWLFTDELLIKMTFLVVPECIWVEERFTTGGTHQPHSYMHSAHMYADHGMWGWWHPCATFNMAFVHSFSAPNCRQRGCILVGRASSKAGDAAEGGTSGAITDLSPAGAEASGTPSGSWGGSLEMVEVGEWQHFLDGGGTWDMEDWAMTPLRSP